MKFKEMHPLDLRMFDGDGGAAAVGAQGETNGAVPGTTRRGKTGEFSNVLFGKQESATVTPAAEAQDTHAAGENVEEKTSKNTLEDRRKAFRDMINGEYKDVFTEESQRIINRRFKETRTQETQLQAQQPVIELLKQRYGIADGDMGKLMTALENDNSYWTEAAEEAGMSVEQFKEFQKAKRENAAFVAAEENRKKSEAQQAQVQQWLNESAAMKEKFPNFDLNTELQNPHFLSMLRSGTPIEHAYKVMHFDELMSGAVSAATVSTEKRVIDNVRARGARPAENGTTSQSAFTVKDDVSKLTKAERAEIAKRGMRGEKIQF